MLVEELNINHNILKSIKALGYVEATQIQEKCIPVIKLGKDVVGQSSTGSGKTAAFGIPLWSLACFQRSTFYCAGWCTRCNLNSRLN